MMNRVSGVLTSSSSRVWVPTPPSSSGTPAVVCRILIFTYFSITRFPDNLSGCVGLAGDLGWWGSFGL